MADFTGKVVLITGATSGLGATAAISLASQGAKVAITGRREEQGRAVVAQIESAGGEGLFIQSDVTIQADVDAMVARTVDRWGRLDGAVNNAGITGGMFKPVAEFTDDDWNSVIDINLTGVFMSMRAEIPAMLASGGGSIVNISSAYGLNGGDIGNCGYVSSKWGVIGLTKTAAIDYARDSIRVNALCPGYCHSEMVDPYAEAEPALFEKLLERYTATGKLGESHVISDAIEFLLSDKASFISGAAIPVQGGQHSRLY
jgi:NAD(P)-dependent dehydrogenase (short-subunit alcohol dehydrogenase family)